MNRVKLKPFLVLKYLRNKTGQTQAEFAKVIGLTPNNYGQKEKGINRFFLDETELLKSHINETLGTDYSVDQIFLGTELTIGNN